GAPAFRVRPSVGAAPPLLLLPLRPRVGAGVLEVLLLRALPGLALSQRARVGEAASAAGGARVRGARQRLPLLPRHAGAGRDLRPARRARRLVVLSSLAAAAAVAVH